MEPLVQLRVEYVDGSSVVGDPWKWTAFWRGEGVDWVEISNGAGTTRVSGHSLYWVYLEGPAWVVGGGSIGYTNPLGEVIVAAGTGNHEYREIEYMPDLPHRAVKLGHWWPGKKRPPHG